MSRVILLHQKGVAAEVLAEPLRRAGHEVLCLLLQSMDQLRAARADPPDAFIIDLSRSPSQGQSVAVWLRQQKATRRVPILFFAGEPEKVQRVRTLLPDAVYAPWEEVPGALQQALRKPPEHPVVPGTMDAYAGTPLPRKLGLHPGTVALFGAPEGFERQLAPLPEGVQLQRQAHGPAQVVLLFARSQAALEQRFPGATRALAEGGRLWIIWPKKASGVATDLTQTTVRAFGLAAGLVDFKVSAIDETWSGLCFARRRA